MSPVDDSFVDQFMSMYLNSADFKGHFDGSVVGYTADLCHAVTTFADTHKRFESGEPCASQLQSHLNALSVVIQDERKKLLPEDIQGYINVLEGLLVAVGNRLQS